MDVARTNEELAQWRAASGGHVLVPTMGALHRGHLSLIERGIRLAGERGLGGGCVVSVFVNPAQFDQRADLEAYPRDLERDLLVCRDAGASCVYAPSVEEVYPAGEDVPTPDLPEVAREPGLEDAARPGHFAGVCRVLVRLFGLVDPAAAIFGEKDWQQLQVARALVRQEGIGVEIVGAPIARDVDGLALSSRNVRLTREDRPRALAIPRAIEEGGRRPSPAEAEDAMRRVLDEAGVRTSYAVVRDAVRLLAPGPSGPYRSLIGAEVGGVHLLDNGAWPSGG